MASSRNKPSIEPVEAACRAALGKHVLSGQHLVVGLSGGIDSVCLLHALRELRGQTGYRLSALHVHHGLSANADHWSDFCSALCRAWDVPLTLHRVAVERNSADGLEGAARRQRHAAYARSDGDFVVLAHHRGDQAETLLFNLLRGTGIGGAAAMTSCQNRLLRPLLPVSRSQISRYARAHGLDWVEDESNQDTAFSRNFLRHEILKSIAARFPAAEKNFAAATQRFGEAATLLDDLARIDLGTEDANFPISVSLLAGLSEPRGRNVLRHLLARRGVGIPSESRMIEALRQLLSAAPDRHPRVRFGDWVLVRRRGKIEIDLSPPSA